MQSCCRTWRTCSEDVLLRQLRASGRRVPCSTYNCRWQETPRARGTEACARCNNARCCRRGHGKKHLAVRLARSNDKGSAGNSPQERRRQKSIRHIFRGKGEGHVKPKGSAEGR